MLPALLAALVALPPQAQPQTPTPVPVPPSFSPWFYQDGHLVWDRHQFFEDNANTVYTLAFDFVSLGAQQPNAVPDVLLFNAAQFEPPEGMPAAPGTRQIQLESIETKGLQLYVNYSEALVAPGAPQTYLSPIFFIALDALQNVQTDPPVIMAGLSSARVSATRGALGVLKKLVAPHARTPFLHEPGADLSQVNALYVTCGVGYGRAAFDGPSQTLWDEACSDRLFLRNPDQTWSDQSTLVPSAVLAGNSSGACFADFDGDGYMDLYVGLCGDDYVGAQNHLLLWRGLGFQDATATNLPAVSDATVDVAAWDLDGDGDQDIVVANRTRRDGAAPGAEAEDYALINNGAGVFTRLVLAPGVYSDTRSVAVGELDYKLGAEIVLGNAGSDGFSNVKVVPVSEDHKMQIFRNTATPPALAFVDDTDAFVDPAHEREYTGPFTQQVLLADLFGDPSGPLGGARPDGRADLFIVNHRDILSHPDVPPGNVRVLVQGSSQATRRLIDFSILSAGWAKTLALADFTHNDSDPMGHAEAGTLDLFIGTGNRFSGFDSTYVENLGNQDPPWNGSEVLIGHLSYDAMPGNERGYGFDFADFDRNGMMDALQTSRGYDYFVDGIGGGGGGGHASFWHRNLTGSGSPFALSNARGRLSPAGMEDGVFADFDRDGAIDALMASQNGSSGTYPFGPREVPETILLHNLGTSSECAVKDVAAQDVPAGGDPTITVDKRIDLGGRTAFARPSIADRAVAGDLDNDGDVDAIVHLFQVNPQNTATIPLADPPNNGFNLAGTAYSCGWRYLKNVFDPAFPNRPWLIDVAASEMVDDTGQVALPYWNRMLGMDVLADFDDNGALDLCSTVAPHLGVAVQSIEQDFDRLFMNAWNGAPAGRLTEVSSTHLPRTIVNPGQPNQHSLWSVAIAQGDIDNDGYADLYVPKSGRLTFKGLFMNRWTTAGGFVEDFTNRIPHTTSDLDTNVIHSGGSGTLVDESIGCPAFLDFDADGDLDLVYPVANNVPRFLRNKGEDTNGDGVIDTNDTSPRGFFEDVTAAVVARIRPVIDSVDTQAVDLDGDGDLDLAIDCFQDEVVPWRNDLVADPARPVVAEAWPRIGSIQGTLVELEGAHLDAANVVELRYDHLGAVVLVRNLTLLDAHHLRFRIPPTAPLGLAQIRVRRLDAASSSQVWSTQYFGYDVLDAP
jgi:hypothetical protein